MAIQLPIQNEKMEAETFSPSRQISYPNHTDVPLAKRTGKVSQRAGYPCRTLPKQNGDPLSFRTVKSC
jgi:hypothetical protein